MRIWKAAYAWDRAGRPLPPPHALKQAVVLAYARRFNLRTFVETGTYRGDMVAGVCDHFDRVFSIELDPVLYERARERFAANARVSIVEGDSAQLLPSIVQRLHTPALFWLDGHFSGGDTARGTQDTPVRTELSAILSAPAVNHVILIDDARLFTGAEHYPSVADLERVLDRAASSWRLSVETDIIRITRS